MVYGEPQLAVDTRKKKRLNLRIRSGLASRGPRFSQSILRRYPARAVREVAIAVAAEVEVGDLVGHRPGRRRPRDTNGEIRRYVQPADAGVKCRSPTP